MQEMTSADNEADDMRLQSLEQVDDDIKDETQVPSGGQRNSQVIDLFYSGVIYLCRTKHGYDVMKSCCRLLSLGGSYHS